jgi:hypothetical protein
MYYFMYDPNFDPANAVQPTPEMMQEMGNFVAETVAAKVLIATGALNQSGTRLTRTEGKFTVTDGPFIELKELMAGFAVIEAKSLEEAIEWAKRFRNIVGDGTSEIVQMYGPHDFAPQ